MKAGRLSTRFLLIAISLVIIALLTALRPTYAGPASGTEFNQFGKGEATNEGVAISAAHADAQRRANAFCRPNRAVRIGLDVDGPPLTFQDPKTGNWTAGVTDRFRSELPPFPR